jgi:excisionase family DNA binding protein
MPLVETSETPFLSISEAARLANVSRVHVWRLVRDGAIDAVRVGPSGSGPIRIPLERFLAWLYAPEEEL